MIVVTVGDHHELDVLGIEAERVDIGQEVVGVGPVQRVDQHVPSLRRQQPGRDPADADVVHVVERLVRLDLLLQCAVGEEAGSMRRDAAGFIEFRKGRNEWGRLAPSRQLLSIGLHGKQSECSDSALNMPKRIHQRSSRHTKKV
jgi:hypothetical protein